MSYFTSEFYKSEFWKLRFFQMTGGGPPPPPVTAELGISVGGAGALGGGIAACDGIVQPNVTGITGTVAGGIEGIMNTCP